MAAVVAKDLADGYRAGAAYLSHTVGWVSGLRADPRLELADQLRAQLFGFRQLHESIARG